MKLVRLSQIACALLALALPIAILADLNQTVTLLPNTSLNLDTGAVVSGGDLLWNGVTLLPPGTAKATITGQTGATAFAGLTQQAVQAFSSQATNSAIPSASLTPGTILAAFTNGGHAAKVIVKDANSSQSSITLQFTTFGVTAGSTGPSITNVLNNSSEIPAGFSNSGIAQGSLFKVLGSDLANDGDASLHDSTKTLPTILNGASIGITVNGVTKVSSLYYATPSQIDGVLPSDTPMGSGTLTLTRNNGTPSSSFPIQVVAAAPGITTYNGSGVAQHALSPTGAILTYTDSGAPGETIIIWGTGLGPTPDSDTAYTTTPHQTTVPYTLYIGGVPVTNIAYVGRSVYPGVGVIGVTIPLNVPSGCAVPVAAVAKVGDTSVVSNIVTLPIHPGNGTCSDSQTGVSGDQVSVLFGQDTVNTGSVMVTQATTIGNGSTTINTAQALFQQVAGSSYHPGGGVSVGSCLLTQTTSGSTSGSTTPLKAGTITVTPPSGSPIALTLLSPGFYGTSLSSIPSTGGAYVLNATAGSQIGAFTTTVNFPNPLLSWGNQNSALTITRKDGLTITWTGGSPGSYITITGTSTSGTLTGKYTCFAPQAAGQFTVPSYILLGLPPGSGSTSVSNANVTPFSALGLDFGNATGTVSVMVNSTYN